jgi:hypothetical protein
MRRVLLLSLLLLAAADVMAGKGKIVIVNNDRPDLGFNDPTPVAPIAGNSGTTLGQQRLNVFNAAAERWTTMIDTDVDIIANATFSPIAGCTATEAVLGQAAPFTWLHSFKNAPKANVWYPIALANKFAGEDLRPGVADIFVQFNGSLDNATCLGETDWYYGLDGNDGADIDLYVVVLHELGHGLGIAGATRSPGFLSNLPAVFDTHVLDTKAGLRWDQMTASQRQISLTNTGNLVWDGDLVRAHIKRWLQPVTMMAISEPAIVARNYDIGAAAFGPDASRTSLSGQIVAATDAANTDGPTTLDGCTAFTNAAAVSGKVAMVNRGDCTFVQKAQNAQAAGARALVVVDNSRETCTPPGMAGDAPDVTIPVVSISAIDGDVLRAQLTANANVQMALRTDPTQLAGTSPEGFVRLYAPCTNDPGSSTHHWDVAASPNLLMEPSVNADLLHGVDLTIYQLLDIGWTLPARSGRPAGKRR